jgi:hypothetical protein
MQVIFIIAIVIGVIWLYFWLLSLFFRYVALYVFALGAIAMTVMVFVNYFRALGAPFSGEQDGKIVQMAPSLHSANTFSAKRFTITRRFLDPRTS